MIGKAFSLFLFSSNDRGKDAICSPGWNERGREGGRGDGNEGLNRRGNERQGRKNKEMSEKKKKKKNQSKITRQYNFITKKEENLTKLTVKKKKRNKIK